MGSSFLFIIFVGILIVAVWMGILFGLRWKFNLSLMSTHSGFLQAWIYIFQTAALVATLVYIGIQTNALKTSIKTNTVQLMVSAQRDLLSKALEHPELYQALAGKDAPASSASNIYLSMFFNHGFNAFSLRQGCYVDDDWWAAIVRDMKDVMRRDSMFNHWKNIKSFYPSRYQTFVDHNILGDEKELGSCDH
jgi:hypothetical protein